MTGVVLVLYVAAVLGWFVAIRENRKRRIAEIDRDLFRSHAEIWKRCVDDLVEDSRRDAIDVTRLFSGPRTKELN